MAKRKYNLIKGRLEEALRTGKQVRLYLMNGFQMIGEPIVDFDNESFQLRVDGKIKTIMFHALSTLETV